MMQPKNRKRKNQAIKENENPTKKLMKSQDNPLGTNWINLKGRTKMSMTYYIEAKEMTAEEFKKFVIANMLSTEELLKKARKKSKKQMPRISRSVITLQELVNAYNEIPSKDLTIYFCENEPILAQDSSGGGDLRKMKDVLRQIVRNHIAKKLREAGKKYKTWRF